jgi:alkanesulfonate monooxygenase
LPIYVSGASAASDELAGRHGDVYLLPSEPVHQLGSRMTRAVALAGGRPLRFGLRLRPLVAATRRDADQYATRVARRQRTSELPVSALLREATGAIGNPRELIGTPETVADALLRYREWGIEVFHLVGYEPLSDLAGFAEVIDLVRRAEAVAVRTIAG